MKYAPWAILAVTMIALVMMRQDTIRQQAEKMLLMNQHVNVIETQNAELSQGYNRLFEENQALTLENQRLRDTIAMLRSELESLHAVFNDQRNMISNYEKQLSANKVKIQKLQAEIQRLKGDPPAVMAAKQEKVNEILAIQKASEQVEVEREKTYDTMGQTESTIVFKELEELRMKQVDAIRNNTTVNYKQVECKQQRSGKPIGQLQDDGTNWVFTTITFDMQNPEQGRLFEEAFRLKIIDTDTGEELPYLESNPAFNQAKVETTGFTFQWRENPVKTLYINLQAKVRKNYSARLYYVNDNQEYMIAGSEVKVIQKGKVVGM